MKQLFYCAVGVSILFLASCVGYSKFPIMRTPNLKVDENLFGMWKAVGDTNKDNFFLVQSAHDKYYTIERARKEYGSIENWMVEFEKGLPEEGRIMDVDTQGRIISMLGREVKDMFNVDYNYYVSYINKRDKKPIYKEEEVPSYRIANTDFVSVSFLHNPDPISKKEEVGYLIFKLLKIAPDTIAVSQVIEPYTSKWGSQERLKKELEDNVNNKAYFGDTIKLYKVKGGHYMTDEALEYMNK